MRKEHYRPKRRPVASDQARPQKRSAPPFAPIAPGWGTQCLQRRSQSVIAELLQVGVVFFLQDLAGFANADFCAGRTACQSARRACDHGAAIVAAVHGAFRPHLDVVEGRAKRPSEEVEWAEADDRGLGHGPNSLRANLGTSRRRLTTDQTAVKD